MKHKWYAAAMLFIATACFAIPATASIETADATPRAGRYIIQSRRHIVGVDTLAIEDALEKGFAFNIHTGMLKSRNNVIEANVIVLRPVIGVESGSASADPSKDGSALNLVIGTGGDLANSIMAAGYYRPKGSKTTVHLNIRYPFPDVVADVVLDPYILKKGDKYQLIAEIWCVSPNGINFDKVRFNECKKPLPLDEFEQAVSKIARRLPAILGNVVLNNTNTVDSKKKRKPVLDYYIKIEEPVVVPLEQSTPAKAR